MSAATVWPRAEVSLSQEGRVRINIGGVTSTPETENLEGARAVVVDFIARRAAALGRAIPTSIQEPTGTWPVDIQPDGTVSSDGRGIGVGCGRRRRTSSGQGSGDRVGGFGARTDLRRLRSSLPASSSASPAGRAVIRIVAGSSRCGTGGSGVASGRLDPDRAG